MILWNGVPGRMKAVPGNYSVRIRSGKDSVESPFTVLADPNYKVTQAEYEQQHAFLWVVMQKFNQVQKTIKDIRVLRGQVNDLLSRSGKETPVEIKKMSDSLLARLTNIEETLYQTKAKSGQDVLNYPIRLNDKLSGVFNAANSGHFAPSKQVREVYADLAAQTDQQLAKFKSLLDNEVPQLNQLIREKQVPVIGIKNE
jgi:hypothetical protein